MSSHKDEWTLTEFSPEGSPERWFFRKNVTPEIPVGHPAYPYLAYLTFAYSPRDESGLPSSSDDDVLFRIEEEELGDLLADALAVRIRRRESPYFRPTRRALKGVIKNFLSTYTSRYTDFGGYWLFGFLCRGPAIIQIDLLGDKTLHAVEPAEVARIIALDEFADQLAKARLPVPWLRQAQLTLARGEQAIERMAGGVLRRGYEMRFEVGVTSDQGTRYHAECARFVAPHDPLVERRSLNPRI